MMARLVSPGAVAARLRAIGGIDRYIALAFLRGAAPVLFVLLALFGFLDLTEELEDVGTGAFASADAILATLYSLPTRAIDLLPVSALLGTLIGLGALASNQEITAMRAAGLSLWRIGAPLCAAAATLIAIVLALQFSVVPKLERDVARLHARTSFQAADDRIAESRWLRSGNHFVRIGEVGRRGVLREVDIFTMDGAGGLARLQRAERARILGDGRWLLYQVRESVPEAAATTDSTRARDYWSSGLDAAQSANLVAPVETLAPNDLYRYITVLEENQLNAQRYRVMFWQKVTLPLELFAMGLLGLPFIVGSARSRSVGQRVAIGAGVGILVYFSNQLIGEAAVLYRVNAFLAGVVPDLLLLAAALAGIHRVDHPHRA